MNKELKYLLLILIIFITACIETDTYLPAFPDMMTYFSVSEETIQSLLTWNFIGICLSGLLYGPLSDSLGRKRPLMVALSLFLMGSLITLFADGFKYMLWGRFLQGLGSGGCFTLGTAIIFDAFQAEKAIKAINKLNMIAPFIMAVAPMAGGYLNYFYGFRSNFLAIAIFVLISLITCLLCLEETLAAEKRAPFQAKKVLDDFKMVIMSVPFWQTTLIISLLFAGYMAFLSVTSVLFVLEFGVSKQFFPLFQVSLLVTWLIASLCCNRSIATYGTSKIKFIGVTLIILGVISFILAALLAPQNPYLFTGAMILYSFGTNWAQGLYFPEGMEIFPDIKGVTASLLTSARLLITAGIVGLTGYLYNATIYPVVGVLLGITVIILPTILLYEGGLRSPFLKSFRSDEECL
jgi:DHA1 family bicyclomycin/chloramphenicol resistance-like MFS transporter